MCIGLGYTHPDYLLNDLTAAQLYDWQQYAAEYGLPARRNDIHFGMFMAMFYNAHRDENHRPEPPATFMPWADPYPDITVNEMHERVKAALGHT